MTSGESINLLQNLAALATPLSIVGGTIAFLINASKERRVRQEQLYADIDDVFTEFQKTILQWAHLDVAWIPLESPPILTDQERVQRSVIFELATSMFERAFLLYATAPRSVRNRQWHGWVDYIKGYCRRQAFFDWWHDEQQKSGETAANSYDAEFERFVNKLFKEVARGNGS